MRIVVVGATGNVGTSVVEALADEPAVDSVVGVDRRIPRWEAPKTEWVAADVPRRPRPAVGEQPRWCIWPGCSSPPTSRW